jgi:predicted membrane channel-forming protein YqfA (hemolysin III family)
MEAFIEISQRVAAVFLACAVWAALAFLVGAVIYGIFKGISWLNKKNKA